MARLQRAAKKTREVEHLRARLAEAEETLSAIRCGDVDAIAVDGPNGHQIYTLETADRPYRLFAESMSEGAASLTREGTIVFCNPALGEMVGQVQEKLLGAPAANLVVPDERRHFQQLLAIAVHNLARAEVGFRRQDGTALPVLVSLKPMLADQPPGICLIATDLSDRKRAEGRATAEREKFNTILDSVPPYVCLLTPDYHVAFANREFKQRFGEAPGLRCYEALFNRTEPCEVCESYKVLKDGKPRRWEWYGPDGRHYDVYDFPFTDTDGSKLILEMGIDVTERKRAEAAASAERQRFEAVLESLPALICLLTPDHEVAFANKAFRDRFGEARGRKCYDYVFGKSAPCEFCEAFQVFDTNRPHDWECSATGGQVLHVYNMPFTDVDGSPLILEMNIDITEQRRAEDEIRTLNRELEERVRNRTAELQTILDTAPIGLAISNDPEARHIRGNLAIERMLGASQGEELSKGDSNCVPYRLFSDGREMPVEELPMQRAARGENVTAYEMDAVRSDGQRTSMYVNAAPLFADDHKPRGAVGAFIDITARVQAEAELERTRDQLAEGQRIAHLGTFEYIAATQTTVWSEEEYRIYGLDPLVPSPAYDVLLAKSIPPDDAELLDRTFKNAIATRSNYELEHRIVRPDGSLRWVYDVAYPYLDETGELVRYVGATLDITARKRAEEALRESESRFRTLANSVPELVWTCTPDGSCDFLNSRWVDYTGIPERDQLGDAWMKQTHPDERMDVLAEWKKAVEGGRLFDVEYRIRSKEGHYRWFKTRAVAVRDQQNRVVKWFGTNTDIEDLRRSQEALAVANKELEAFSYSVSHDLRAPLRHISGFSKILSEDFGPQLPEDAQHHLQRIQDGTRRMGQLVDDLLNLSRVGRHELRQEISSLDNILRQVLTDLQPEYEDRDVQWKIGKLPFAECDASLVKQVFQNLLANALKFTRPRKQPVIEIGCKQDEGAAVIFVRDNGVGFNMKYAGKLFGVFQRMHRAEDFEGTGVGLATVQRIVQKHGGQVWAEAELDKGATLYFTLPGSAETCAQEEAHHAVRGD